MTTSTDFSSNNYPSVASTYSCTNSNTNNTLSNNISNSNNSSNNFIGRHNLTNSVVSAACSPYGITAIGYASVYGSPSCYSTMPPPQHLPQHEKSCSKDR